MRVYTNPVTDGFRSPGVRSTVPHRVVLEHELGGRVQRNVFHFVAPVHVGQRVDPQSVADLYNVWWNTPIPDEVLPPVHWTAGARLVRGVVFEITDLVLGRSVLSHLLEFLPGDEPSPGTPMPGNATLAMSWYCARSGRECHGRTFVPWLDRSFVLSDYSSTLDPAYQDAMERSYNALFTWFDLVNDTSGGGWKPVILHKRAYPNGALLDGFADEVVRAKLTDRTLDSQYRRLPGHRAHGRK